MATPPLSVFLLFALLTWSLADPMTSEATTGDASSTMLAINTTEDTADMIDVTALEITTTFDDTAITTISSENTTVEMTTSVMTSQEVTTTGVDMTTMPATTSTLTTTRTARTTRPTTVTRTPDADQNEIVVIRKGEVLILDCYLEEDNGVREETYWLFDGTRRFNGSSLSIPNLNHTHHGRVIECINKTTVVQRRTIHYHHVNVLAVNETLKLNCTFDPTAATNVQWKHSVNGPKSDWNITNLDNVTSQLIVHEVTLNDTGVYKCLSSQGDVLKVFNISIGFKPRVPNFVCSGCNTYEYRCEWPEVFDTHLPTEVTFEYKK